MGGHGLWVARGALDRTKGESRGPGLRCDVPCWSACRGAQCLAGRQHQGGPLSTVARGSSGRVRHGGGTVAGLWYSPPLASIGPPCHHILTTRSADACEDHGRHLGLLWSGLMASREPGSRAWEHRPGAGRHSSPRARLLHGCCLSSPSPDSVWPSTSNRFWSCTSHSLPCAAV